MRVHTSLWVVAFVALFISATASASGTVKVYGAQAGDLQSKVDALLKRIESLKRQQVRDGKKDLLEESLALKKLVHRLQEDAMQVDADDADDQKSLLLVGQACQSLDYALGAVDAFIYSGDRAFIGFAKDGLELTTKAVRLL